MVDPEKAKRAFWLAIYKEVKPFERWPNDAGSIAHSLCQWRESRNYYHITAVKNRLLENGIKLTPTVNRLIAEGDAWEMTGRTKGKPATARKYEQLEAIYFFMANLMYKRPQETMPLELAALYAATEFKGIYKASSLCKKYKKDFKDTELEADLYRYIDSHIPDHYELWTKAIEQRTPDPKLKGNLRGD